MSMPIQPENKEEEKELADEFLLLRYIIGIMGIVLPIILVGGTAVFSNCKVIQPSISHYYYTNMGNVFVAYVICLTVFLLAYPGYEKDHVWSKLAFVFGCIFPFLPTLNDPCACLECHNIFPWRSDIIGKIHISSASLFIAVLAYYSLFLFTKTNVQPDPDKDEEKKKRTPKEKRNLVYQFCGAIMFATLLFLATLFVLDAFNVIGATYLLEHTNVVFWGEVVALEFFGISWVVKGGALWRDVNDPHPTTMKMAKQFLFKRKIK